MGASPTPCTTIKKARLKPYYVWVKIWKSANYFTKVSKYFFSKNYRNPVVFVNHRVGFEYEKICRKCYWRKHTYGDNWTLTDDDGQEKVTDGKGNYTVINWIVEEKWWWKITSFCRIKCTILYWLNQDNLKHQPKTV